MSYAVKEIYYTLQGEGGQAGRAAVFCRFSGCNLWSGQRKDKSNSTCWFCDTDFVGTDGENGGSYRDAEKLAEMIASCWKEDVDSSPCVVFTGGEPLLQLDEALLKAMNKGGFETAVETNGTIKAPAGIDWLTVSPKRLEDLVQTKGTELKLLYPSKVSPKSVENLDFEYFYLSPVNVEDKRQSEQNLQEALAYCCTNPHWRLTIQHHKLWAIP